MTMRNTIATVLLLSPVLVAQEPPSPASAAQPVVHGRFGIDFTSGYYFRGIQQENQGVIAQPWLDFGYGLYEADDDASLRKLDLTFGLWNSLHDGPTGGAGGIWYESDFRIGLDAKVGDRMSMGTSYTAFHSPNQAPTFSRGSETVEELGFSFGYDDRGQLFESLTSGLQPKFLLAIELDGQRDGGNHVGVYAEVGVEPTFLIGQLGEADLTLHIPVTAGFSLSDYYERPNTGDDDFFGFLDLGAVVMAPLQFLPARMGPWEADAGLHFLLLGDNNEARNNGDTSEILFTLGLRTRF